MRGNHIFQVEKMRKFRHQIFLLKSHCCQAQQNVVDPL